MIFIDILEQATLTISIILWNKYHSILNLLFLFLNQFKKLEEQKKKKRKKLETIITPYH